MGSSCGAGSQLKFQRKNSLPIPSPQSQPRLYLAHQLLLHTLANAVQKRASHTVRLINGMNDTRAAQTLAGSFNALADEVQLLIDRNTILEHKLRYAHEQV